MEPIFRIKAAGLESRLPHLDVSTTHTGETVVFCTVCGESLRDPWPGLVDTLETWAAAHQHDGVCDHKYTWGPRCVKCGEVADPATPRPCPKCGALVLDADHYSHPCRED